MLLPVDIVTSAENGLRWYRTASATGRTARETTAGLLSIPEDLGFPKRVQQQPQGL